MTNSRIQKPFIFMATVTYFLSGSMFAMMPRAVSKVFQPTSAIASTLCSAIRHCAEKNLSDEQKQLLKIQKALADLQCVVADLIKDKQRTLSEKEPIMVHKMVVSTSKV